MTSHSLLGLLLFQRQFACSSRGSVIRGRCDTQNSAKAAPQQKRGAHVPHPGRRGGGAALHNGHGSQEANRPRGAASTGPALPALPPQRRTRHWGKCSFCHPRDLQTPFPECVRGRHWNSGLPLRKKHRFCSQGKSQPVFRVIRERQLK